MTATILFFSYILAGGRGPSLHNYTMGFDKKIKQLLVSAGQRSVVVEK